MNERAVVFVHGRDFKPEADELLKIDVAAVSAGIERDCPEMLVAFYSAAKGLAYYGDISNAWLRGQELTVHGWIYGIGDGLLRDLGKCVTCLEELPL